MRSRALSGLCLLWLVLRAPFARAEGPAPAEAAVPPELTAWLTPERDPSGRACDGLGVLVIEARYAVACGDAGLWIVRRDASRGFALVRVEDLGAPVVALFVRNGQLWAELRRTEARVVTLGSDGASAAFPADTAAAPPRPSPASKPKKPAAGAEAPGARPKRSSDGRVTEVRVGEVVVDLGWEDWVRDGDHVELSLSIEEKLGTESAARKSVVAVGRVTAVSPGFSRVKLGIGERVPLGAAARVVPDELTAARAAPPRVGGLWEVGFMARPFLALGELGGGFLLDAFTGYRFEAPFHLVAELLPLAHGTGKDKVAITPVSAFVKASYDLPLFEVGLGVGVETVYDTDFGSDAGSGTLFAQHARMGAVDGVHLDTQTHVVLFHSEFQFSGFTGSGQIPVGQSSFLIFRGGGGSAGYAFGELAVRVLVSGNGDRGSFFFTGAAGGAGIFKRQETLCGQEFVSSYPCTEDVTYAGPMLGAGGEWRF